MNRWLLKDKNLLSESFPFIVGILNVTDNSFYDGGMYSTVEKAVFHAKKLVSEGASCIDIGGESSRPGSDRVDEKTEKKRVIPVIKAIREEGIDIPISIDTYKASVAFEAIESGANIINDISAFLFDKEMVSVASEKESPVILMHMKGEPKNMQDGPYYDDVVKEVMDFFLERVEYAISNGVERSCIMLDAGIGFGKTLEHNKKLIASSSYLSEVLDLPIMVGASRKKIVGDITGENVSGRLFGSIGIHIGAVLNGAVAIRVHDVKPFSDAVKCFLEVTKEDV